MRFIHRIFCLLLIVNCSVITSAMAKQFTEFDVGEKKISLSEFTTELYVDISKSATIEDIVAGKIAKEFTSSRFSLPLEKANYWFSFTLHNQSTEAIERIIVIDEPFLYQVDFYSQDNNNHWKVERNGIAVPVFERAIPTRLPHFMLDMQPGEKKKVYLSIKAVHSLVAFGIEVKDPYIARMDEQLKIAGYWLFFGISLAMLIYNLFLFISLRDYLYCYYSLYCGSFFMFVLQYSGFHLMVVESSFIHYALASFVPLTLAFLALFIGKVLDSKKNLPKLHLLICFVAIILFIETLLTFINTDYYFITLLLGMPVTLFLFLVTVYGFIKKIPLANYLLFGMSWHVLGLFAVAGVNLGLLEYGFLTRYGFILGSVIELLVFSVALAHRVRLLQKQKNEFQYELLALAKKEKKALKSEMERKDKELLAAKDKVENLLKMDALTGLYNRAHFDTELAKWWEITKKNKLPLSIILAEFSHLQLYRESYGKQTGDYSLRLMAQTLTGCVGQEAEIVARYSDNRFVLLLPHCSKSQTTLLIEKIKASIDLIKIPFKASPTGRVEMLFVGDAFVPEGDASSKQFLDDIEQVLLYR